MFSAPEGTEPACRFQPWYQPPLQSPAAPPPAQRNALPPPVLLATQSPPVLRTQRSAQPGTSSLDGFASPPQMTESTPANLPPTPAGFPPAPEGFAPPGDDLPPAPTTFAPAPEAFAPTPDDFPPTPDHSPTTPGGFPPPGFPPPACIAWGKADVSRSPGAVPSGLGNGCHPLGDMTGAEQGQGTGRREMARGAILDAAGATGAAVERAKIPVCSLGQGAGGGGVARGGASAAGAAEEWVQGQVEGARDGDGHTHRLATVDQPSAPLAVSASASSPAVSAVPRLVSQALGGGSAAGAPPAVSGTGSSPAVSVCDAPPTVSACSAPPAVSAVPRLVLQVVGGGDDDAARAWLPALAEKLGGLYIASPVFDSRCTHMVVVQLKRSEKLLAALAAGLWLLHPSWIDACAGGIHAEEEPHEM